MKTINEFRNNPRVIIGRWGRHAPGHPCTDRIAETTHAKILAALADGKTILIGNSPRGPGVFLARTNSRYHGFTIRTIRAV